MYRSGLPHTLGLTIGVQTPTFPCMTMPVSPARSTTTDDRTARAIRALRAASAHLEWTLARALETHGLTTAQFAVLQALREAEPHSLACSELGHRLVGPASDVTRLVDRLESAGLVSRERDKTDRRLVFTRLTLAGGALLERAEPCVQGAEENALTGLDGEERESLAKLLVGIRGNCPCAT